jgi:probable rRNA maturation factor
VYKIIVANKQKRIKIPTGLQLLIRRCCNAVLREEQVKPPAELSVTFLNDVQIQELNREYRNIDLPTDVLAFPLGEGGVYEKNLETGCTMLGDVVISIEMAKMQADVYNHSFEREIGFLTVHGVLHILGYDHERSIKEADIMREKEREIITKVGLCVHEISPVSKFLKV